MKINNKKIITTTLLIITILTIIGGVSANDTPNETTNTNNQEIIHKDNPNSLSDTSTTNKKTSSNDEKENINKIKTEEKNYDKLNSNEKTIYISTTGNDNNTGDSDKPVATIKKAINLTKTNSGKIIIKEGTYHENDITINGDKPISIIGEGQVTIDNNGLEKKSIFNIETKELIIKNIIFTNNKAKYGSALFIEGSSSNPLNINILIENCSFNNLEATRGGAIYAHFAKGNLNISNCNFTKSNATWGAICLHTCDNENGLNLNINNSNFKNNYANNAGALYLMQTGKITIINSSFYNNTALSEPSTIYLNNCTAIFDNCFIYNNTATKNNPTILITGRKVQLETDTYKMTPSNIVISNCIIENNTANESKTPVIKIQNSNLDISYSSIVNEFDIENTVTSNYNNDQPGNLTANNNWWGTNNPFTKITGNNIKLNNWIIMNVVANASTIDTGDKVKLSIDFNHLNTNSGEIEDLNLWKIPKIYTIKLNANKGSIDCETSKISYGETKEFLYSAVGKSDTINIETEEFIKNIIFKDVSEINYGPIYVAKNGDDNYNGIIDCPVASISKAIELASIEGGSGQIIITEGTYKGHNYNITKDLTITGQGKVIIDAECNGRLFYMSYGTEIDKIYLSNLILTGSNKDILYSFARELVLDNISIIDNFNVEDLITVYGNLTIKNSKISNNNGGDVIYSSVSSLKNANIIINNTLFENNIVNDSNSDYGIIYTSGKGNLIVENSQFINNTLRHSVIVGSNNINIDVKNSKFSDNTVTVGYGGAIRVDSNLNLENSTFINNHANKDGGAIYVGLNAYATIIKSSFINNSVGNSYNGDAIYNKGHLSINYCVLLTNASDYLIYNSNLNTVLDAKYNWWGTNYNPKSLVSGAYDDEDKEAKIDVSNWVIMNVDMSDNVTINHKTIFNIDFEHYNSSSSINKLIHSIPEIIVNVFAVNGKLDKNEVITVNNIAKITYIATVIGEDSISFNSNTEVISKKINVIESENDPILIVTPETIDLFFDADGILEPYIQSEELIFTGEFKDLQFTINKSINLTGHNALFNNTVFNIIADNVIVNNITFIADKFIEDINSIIYVGGNNVCLENNKITYNAPNIGDSYVIYIDSTESSNILNNTIIYTGNLGENIKAITVYAINSADMTMKNNVIQSTIPALPTYPNILSSNVILENITNINLENNTITVNYNGADGEYDTIYAIQMSGSSDAKIIGNIIEIYGYSYAYGLAPNGFENIEISKNSISSYAIIQSNAIEFYGKSKVIIEDNNISSIADIVVYPINLSDLSQTADVTINNNNISGESNIVYGIYTQGHKTLISNNIIDANGNYTIGIVSHMTDVIINNNSINSNGNNIGDAVSPQNGIPVETTAIITSHGIIEIKKNNLTSTGHNTIEVFSCNGTIKDNMLRLNNGAMGDVTISQSLDSNLSIDNNKSSEDSVEVVKPEIEISAYPIVKPQSEVKTEDTVSSQVKNRNKIILKLKLVKSLSKRAKKLVLSANLKINGKSVKFKKVIFIVKGKKFIVKTNKKGIAKLTIKRVKLRKILSKVRIGKKIKYRVKYGKKIVTRFIVIKR